jgi:GTP-binding protein
VHFVDGTLEDVKAAYRTIRNELGAYAEELAEKPEIVVLNKIDALAPEDVKKKLAALKRLSKTEVLAASGATHQGIDAVLYRILAAIDGDQAERKEAERRSTQPHWVP